MPGYYASFRGTEEDLIALAELLQCRVVRRESLEHCARITLALPGLESQPDAEAACALAEASVRTASALSQVCTPRHLGESRVPESALTAFRSHVRNVCNHVLHRDKTGIGLVASDYLAGFRFAHVPPPLIS